MDLDDSLRAFVLGIIFVIVSVLSRLGRDLLLASWIGEYTRSRRYQCCTDLPCTCFDL